jgi:muramoyltetrapeptide carboxypeptidase
MNVIKPVALKPGDTIGVFTPSFPGHLRFREKYQHGLTSLRCLGFGVVEGSLTRSLSSQGYRTGTAAERAAEFMELIIDPAVKGLVATIGGCNSSSLIPYLDFPIIREHPKVISGYSDITALHMAILMAAGVSTFYGPAVVPSFGEWPELLPETWESFRLAVTQTRGQRSLTPPSRFSDHFRDATTDEWRTADRQYHQNPGWKVLRPGTVHARAVIANLDTLVALAGTPYFPDVQGRLLILEEMTVRPERFERSLRHLDLLGIFDHIAGLILSKPESCDWKASPLSLEDILWEVVGDDRNYPIVTDFDCGHTHPMLTVAQMTPLSVFADVGRDIEIIIEEPMVNDRTEESSLGWTHYMG